MSTTFPLSPSDARIAAREDSEALRTAFLSPVTWHQTFCDVCEATMVAPEHLQDPWCSSCEQSLDAYHDRLAGEVDEDPRSQAEIIDQMRSRLL